jgi:hypothetical protein
MKSRNRIRNNIGASTKSKTLVLCVYWKGTVAKKIEPMKGRNDERRENNNKSARLHSVVVFFAAQSKVVLPGRMKICIQAEYVAG